MTQEQALQILKTGVNVFLTGEPGTGKTHVINQYIAWLQAAEIPTAVTASTGIAATHIGGFTIHSWTGLGARDTLTPRDIDFIISKEYVAKRLRKTAVLIIDEISMLSGNTLNQVHSILKTAKQNNEPFGGMQVVFVGDFFQLPPIQRGGGPSDYAFFSEAWQSAKPLTCYLEEQHRHDDELLSSLLASIRSGDIEESHYTLLNEQTDISFSHIEPTRLYTHNQKVDEVNITELKKLHSPLKKFSMHTTGNKMLCEGLIRTCMSPQTLQLTEGAMVMCTKNNYEAGFANGTLGRIIGFDSSSLYPIIETTSGKEITIEPASWSIQDNGKVLAELEQIPLRLAWAITIHKSQGMSLDAAEIDLSRSFAYGQGYVALSRVRTLSGLKVLGMSANALIVDPIVIKTDESFKTASNEAVSTFTAMTEEEIVDLQKNFATTTGKRWPGDNPLPTTTGKKNAPKSTYEITKSLLESHPTIKEIAKERGMTEATILQHLEHLKIHNEITSSTIEQLLPLPDWEDQKAIIFTAFSEHGNEKLKPVYQACNEKYDYVTLRLARLLYKDTLPY